MSVLSVKDLRLRFHLRHGVVHAVDSVSFSIERGETVGIVGESGCGKSVTFLSLLGLIPSPPGRIESGTAHFNGRDLLRCTTGQLRAIRGRHIAMIFQDPMSALNPYLRVGTQVMEPLRLHPSCSRREAWSRAVTALQNVGIPDAERRMRAYPHQLSGGLRQRVMIAMAMITGPQLLIADEPTTALDVTVQAQVLAVIKKAQQETGAAVALITHDMGIVAGTCDRVLVMYAGRIVESAGTDAIFYRPRHPYTKALLETLPAAHQPGQPLLNVPGRPPDLLGEIRGCPFAPRCPHVVDACRETPVSLQPVGDDHASACLRVQAGEI
ncbi:MAG: ABC transporter ATP-binding protein [Candidatus Hydrogenedentes bacterium]|nr:ABC transporter ATP-binding protein [Candidatus Hydrogenedentota bacterium]